jgi:hypothetical protein
MKAQTKTINFETSYGKRIAVDVKIDSDVDILNITINDTFYSKRQCAKHQWLLYQAIKKYLND